MTLWEIKLWHEYTEKVKLEKVKPTMPEYMILPGSERKYGYMPTRKPAVGSNSPVVPPLISGRSFSKSALRDSLSKKLINQDEAVERIIPYITTYCAGMSTNERSVANFLLLGPTGTGKTRTVEAVAEVLAQDENNNFIRVDCSTYEQSHEVAKLTGSPPGYLGHRETTSFFTQHKIDGICKNGLGVILFDEIEKAHPKFTQILLSVLDKGILQLGDNTEVNFKNTLIFFTSNLGATQMMDILNPKLGFSPGVDLTAVQRKLTSVGEFAAKKKFSPEFYNRLDEVITYQPLSADSMQKILDIELNKIWQILFKQNRGLIMLISQEVKDFLSKKGFSPLFGARELNRVIQRELVQPFANFVIDTDFPRGTTFNSLLDGNKVYFKEVVLDTIDIEEDVTDEDKQN